MQCLVLEALALEKMSSATDHALGVERVYTAWPYGISRGDEEAGIVK